VTALASRRRHPIARAVLLVLGLVVTGLVYAAVEPGSANAAPKAADDVSGGHQVFLANCASCHGVNGEGRDRVSPSLIGVGAAAVDFQVGSGRMPLVVGGPQAPKNTVLLTPEKISQLAAYVASLGSGPAIPAADVTDPTKGDASRGALIFRTNCAMCHGAVGKGGALTHGKYAPPLTGTTPTFIYEAMVSGPQSMPVFNDNTIDPQSKRDVIAYLDDIQKAPSPGGISLGGIGPVSEGLVAWLIGLALLIGCAVWLGAKAS
jgi:ubiquinol-cytochrome c reductase cytochrome c subunit